jgi:putative transposase
MTLWRTYYHLVWATRDRHPLITPECELALYAQLRQKAKGLKVPVHAIGGVADHLHLVVSIPPQLAISEFVKLIKGSSSRYINQMDLGITFAWQREYGVFSLGSQQLEQAVNYVENQKDHHHQNTLIRMLEPDALGMEQAMMGQPCE